MNKEIIDIFSSLPQQGPGSDEMTTSVALSLKSKLPDAPLVADFGCGTGRTTLALAKRFPDAQVTAIDNLPPFCAVLRKSIELEELNDRVHVAVGDIREPDIQEGSLDLVWSEGAAYAVVFGEAIWKWSGLLKSGGYCVVSECEWLREDVPPELSGYWNSKYPEMRLWTNNLLLLENLGLEVVDRQVLPESCWDAYYTPLLTALEDHEGGVLKSYAASVVEEHRIRQRYQNFFGYSFYICRKP